jgi:hypothetical protein
MNARLLTRGTNVLLVSITGMTAGHMLMPARPDAGLMRRAGFVLLLALAGAMAGWRERRGREEDAPAPVPYPALWMPLGAVSALALGAVAWLIVHG